GGAGRLPTNGIAGNPPRSISRGHACAYGQRAGGCRAFSFGGAPARRTAEARSRRRKRRSSDVRNPRPALEALMETLSLGVRDILDLGAPVMMPIIITLLGLGFRQGFVKSFRAGLTVGVGFIAIGLVVHLLIDVVGPDAMAFASVLGRRLDILDVGWPMGAAVSFASPIAGPLIPAVLALNVVLVLLRFTRTVDVDLWNYWHFI